jgi:hypothetical protein
MQSDEHQGADNPGDAHHVTDGQIHFPGHHDEADAEGGLSKNAYLITLSNNVL